MKTIEEKIAVMTAFKNGAAIEAIDADHRSIWVAASTPCWDWREYDYRVKATPRHVYAEAHVERGGFTGNVFFPGPDVSMPPTKSGYCWLKLVEVLK